jgi:hypothetical protein
MPKDESTPDFAQEQLIHGIVKEGDVLPEGWCAPRLPEPEAQDVVLHTTLQPHFLITAI